MLTFFNTVLLQLVMPVGRDAVASQAAFDADQRTAVERNDRPTRARSLEQAGNVAADTGNARHFGHAAAVQPHRDMVGELRGVQAKSKFWRDSSAPTGRGISKEEEVVMSVR